MALIFSLEVLNDYHSLTVHFPTNSQSRTDRIVFKLFGKDPSDFPAVLRREVSFKPFLDESILFDYLTIDGLTLYNMLNLQILDWLSHSPTDIESYIRPGCIVLTIYLRLGKSTWDEVSYIQENMKLFLFLA